MLFKTLSCGQRTGYCTMVSEVYPGPRKAFFKPRPGTAQCWAVTAMTHTHVMHGIFTDNTQLRETADIVEDKKANSEL